MDFIIKQYRFKVRTMLIYLAGGTHDECHADVATGRGVLSLRSIIPAGVATFQSNQQVKPPNISSK